MTFSSPGATVPVLDGFDLTVFPTTSVALVGSTGSGKTTADLLLGLLVPQGGEMRVDETTVTPDNVDSWQKNLGGECRTGSRRPGGVTRSLP